jgi:hypothetical protein
VGRRAFVLSGNLGEPDDRTRYDLPPDQTERFVAGFITEVSGAKYGLRALFGREARDELVHGPGHPGRGVLPGDSGEDAQRAPHDRQKASVHGQTRRNPHRTSLRSANREIFPSGADDIRNELTPVAGAPWPAADIIPVFEQHPESGLLVVQGADVAS